MKCRNAVRHNQMMHSARANWNMYSEITQCFVQLPFTMQSCYLPFQAMRFVPRPFVPARSRWLFFFDWCSWCLKNVHYRMPVHVSTGFESDWCITWSIQIIATSLKCALWWIWLCVSLSICLVSQVVRLNKKWALPLECIPILHQNVAKMWIRMQIERKSTAGTEKT